MFLVSNTKATVSWNVVQSHLCTLKIKWIITAFNLIIFCCLTTFCKINFFKYLLLSIFSLGLYSSFLLTKPSAVQYKLSISLRWGTCILSNSSHVNFYFSNLCFSKFCDIKYPFAFLKTFKISSILTLSINVRLKVTRAFCILNSNGKD